jgi:hypothetical protein
MDELRLRRKHHGNAQQAPGVVASRASSWTLEGPDWAFIELQQYFWNPLMQR